MKLSDLKQGMVCELRDGTTFTVVGKGKVHNDENYMFYISDNYENDLSHKRNKQIDIMKVSYGDKVVWERKESTYWEPKEGESYYHLNSFGYIIRFSNNSDVDKSLFNTQLVFKTKEEAEKHLLKQQAKMRVIKEIARLNEGWTPNWENDDEIKFFIGGLDKELVVELLVEIKTTNNNLYLKSKELAFQLIETHEKDLKLMLEVE